MSGKDPKYNVGDVEFGDGIHLIIGKFQSEIETSYRVLVDHFRILDGSTIEGAADFGNSLHHEMIKKRLEFYREVSGRRYFLGTMNPSVIDQIEFSSTEDARKRILLAGPLRNMIPDQARRFWSAYEADFQHVSEILRVEGIW